MCFICSQVNGGICCAAFVNVAFLCAYQEYKPFSGVECNGCSTSCKISQGIVEGGHLRTAHVQSPSTMHNC